MVEVGGSVGADVAHMIRPERVAERPDDAVRELRLALVCYGGVSLAIYMHGITKEIHELVGASAAFERDQDTNPFRDGGSARAYWELLRRQRDESGVRTRVVVDIVSGTSAGGINGVFLAAAIARNRSQEPLGRLWFDNGDIERLVAGPAWLPLALKVPWLVARGLRSRKPPLRGDDMCRWLNDAFTAIDRTPRGPLEGLDSLIPQGQRLQLFVPITDFSGYDVRIPLDDPAWVSDRTHRHVMRFAHDGAAFTQLDPTWNDALAFSARATSSFPGAFPPLSIGDYERIVEGHHLVDDVREVLFPGYALAGVDPASTYFVDGGVLDNKPFASTLEAIKLRPAASEVDRRLLYIEPDPSSYVEQSDDDRAAAGRDGRPPAWIATMLGGYASIPRKEPILDDLTALMRHNVNVDRVRDIIETGFDGVRARVMEHVGTAGIPPVDAGRVTSWREELTGTAEAEAGFTSTTYTRLRIRAVVDDFAALVSDRRRYPHDSTHGYFVRTVLAEWARHGGLLEQRTTATAMQRAFLADLDLGYEDRHLRFVIAALNWWYRPGGTEAATVPDRATLDEAKQTLYQRVADLQDITSRLADDHELVELVDEVFSPTAISGALDRRLSAPRVVEEHTEALGRLDARLHESVGPALGALRRAFDEDVADLTASWDEFARTELLVRHLAFGYWDMLVYPVEALSGLNERDRIEVVRVSPIEARALEPDRAEKDLAGVRLGHFGAFFDREGRENDYLWGRLDGADRLVALVVTPPGTPLDVPPADACRPVFAAILERERPSLTRVTAVVDDLASRVEQLGRAGP